MITKFVKESLKSQCADYVKDVDCKRISSRQIEQFPYFQWISGDTKDFISENILSLEDWRRVLPDILKHHSFEEIESARCLDDSITTFGLDYSASFRVQSLLKEYLETRDLDVFTAAGLPK